MSSSPSSPDLPSDPAWYCVHTRPKSEHIAAGALVQFSGVEVYNPTLRIQRVLPRGKVWFNEALFPCYVFARFVYQESYRAVAYANAVTRILQFGEAPAIVPDVAIEEIRAAMGDQTTRDVEVVLHENDEVELASGPLQGFAGSVTQADSGSERICILIEFLGRLHEVEAPRHAVRTPRHAREFANL